MATRQSILLIEDSPGECELFRLALAQTGLDVALYTEHDAEAAFRFLEAQVATPAGVQLRAAPHPPNPGRAETRPVPNEGSPRPRVPRAQDPADVANLTESIRAGDQTAPPPSLILLDLNLCGQHGRDVLKRLRGDSRFAAIPVVIFTTSDDAADLTTCYANGANGYVVKPSTYAELVGFARDLCGYWIQWNRLAPPSDDGHWSLHAAKV